MGLQCVINDIGLQCVINDIGLQYVINDIGLQYVISCLLESYFLRSHGILLHTRTLVLSHMCLLVSNRILSLLWGSFAKETYNLIDPTKQRHLICVMDTYEIALEVSCVTDTHV